MMVLVDPYVFIVPPVHSSADRVISYISGLQFWLGLPLANLVVLLYPCKCIERALELDVFPYSHTLSKTLSAARVVAYDANTLSRLASTLFESCTPIEDLFSCVAFADSLAVQPCLFLHRLPRAIAAAFRDCLATLAVHKDGDEPGWGALALGTLDDGADPGSELSIRGTLNHSAHGAAQASVASAAHIVDTQVPVIFSYEQLLHRIDWATLWNHPCLGIDKAYFEALLPTERAVHPLRDYTIGGHFIDTIRQLGLQTQPGRVRSIYEACALVICGRAREVSGINPRRVQGYAKRADGAKLMRADISKQGPGYRLHYWQGEYGVVELSSVNVHNDMTVY